MSKNSYQIRERKNIDKIFNIKSNFYYIVKSYYFPCYQKGQKTSFMFCNQDISCSAVYNEYVSNRFREKSQ